MKVKKKKSTMMKKSTMIKKKKKSTMMKKKMISVKVKKGENGQKEEIFMKIDRDSRLGDLMKHYCDKMSLDHSNTKFMFNGARLRYSDTPHRLTMIDDDVIYVFPNSNHQGVTGRSAVCYETLCIRMHKQRDTFLRVIRTQPLLRQLLRHFTSGGPGKHAVMCFEYDRLILTEDHTVEKLNLEDGDIIDAFEIIDCSSSSSTITPDSPRILLKVRDNGDQYQVHYFKVTTETYMRRVAERYAELVSLTLNQFVLLFDGRYLDPGQTVEEAQLEDDCEIDAFMIQFGGF